MLPVAKVCRMDFPRGLRFATVAMLATLIVACASSERHFEKAKRLARVPATPVAMTPAHNQNVLDLRSADVESERYLPVQERLARRQRTITQVLARYGGNGLP